VILTRRIGKTAITVTVTKTGFTPSSSISCALPPTHLSAHRRPFMSIPHIPPACIDTIGSSAMAARVFPNAPKTWISLCFFLAPPCPPPCPLTPTWPLAFS
jgi:hypothetical protein